MKILKRRGNSFRKDNYTTVLLLSLAAALIFRIPLRNLIGDKGIAYFSAANELYLVVAGMLSFGLSEGVCALVRYRVRREQMRSVRKVIKISLLTGLLLGTAVSVLVLFFGHTLASKLMQMPMAGMAVTVMAPAMVFYVLTGALRGYFRGNGFKMAAMHSMLLHTLFLFIGGLIGSVVLYGYGEKVSALLQNTDYANAYGAMGASLGILAASLLCFIHMLVLYLMLKGRITEQMGRELSRTQDTTLDITRMLIMSGGFYGLFYLIFYCRPLVDGYLLYHFSGISEGLDELWGAYYGKYLVLTGVVSGLAALVCLLPVKRITSLMERDEHRGAKVHLGALIHQCAVLVIPATVFLAVLAENVLDLIYQGTNHQTAGWIQLGSIGIVPALFAAVFMDILCKSGRQKAVAVIGAIGLLVHIGSVIFLLSAGGLGVNGLIAGNIIFWAVTAVGGFILVGRIMQYSQEWIRSFAVTIVAAAVCGLLTMLFNKAVTSIAGSVVSLFICLPVGIILYLVLLLVLKAFREEELEIMVGGSAILSLARLLRLM